MATIEEKVNCVLWLTELKSVSAVQREFTFYYNKEAPTENSIINWLEQFRETGSVNHQPGTERQEEKEPTPLFEEVTQSKSLMSESSRSICCSDHRKSCLYIIFSLVIMICWISFIIFMLYFNPNVSHVNFCPTCDHITFESFRGFFCAFLILIGIILLGSILYDFAPQREKSAHKISNLSSKSENLYDNHCTTPYQVTGF